MKSYWILMRRWILGNLILASLWACKDTPQEVELFSIMVDVTDPHIAKPEVSELLSLMDISTNPKQIHLRYASLSDVDYNKVQSLYYKPHGKGLLGNAVKAKRKRVRFERELASLLESEDSVVKADYSAIFEPIIREVYFLSTQKGASNKRLFVFSNLMENSGLANFYKTKDYLLLMQKQKPLVKRFLAVVPDFKTTDVSLQIVYIPHNQKDNIQFKAVEKLYTELFRSLGIRIAFTANIYKAYPEQ